MERLLRIDEVSNLTGLPVATLRWYRQVGKGPRSAKLGNRVVYRLSDIRAWVDASFETDTDRD